VTQLFVSHSAADAAPAAALRDAWLAARPDDRIALSSSPEAGPLGGTSWRSWIRRAMTSADVVLFVASEHSLSPWCSAELGMARLLGTPVISLLTGPGAVVNPIVDELQAHSLDRPLDELLRVVDAQLGARAPTHGLPPDFVPYPGLAALGEQQEALLQGRTAERDRLLADFERLALGSPRYVVVSGPSGSGKSSLVRAGLLPRLRDAGWAIVGPTQPREIGRSGAPSGELGDRAVVVVDQFEELVQLDDAGRRVVLGWLETSHAAGACVLVVVRSEFRTAIGELIPKPIDHYVPFVGVEDLAAIIRVPAKFVQLEVSDELVERLVRETGSGSALPLLAYTLNELWKARDRVAVRLQESTLDSLGGVRGVLAHRADEALRAATDGDPNQAQQVLAALSRLASPEHNPPTRLPVRVGSLTAAERAWFDEFSRVGLLTYRTTYALDDELALDTRPTGDDLVDVTHEALFSWEPLEAAIDRERQRNRTRVAIERAAAQWDESGRRDESLLLAGDRLAFARGEAMGAADPLLADYVAASLRHDRDRRVRRLLTAAVAVIAAVAVALAAVALVQRGRAESARRDADAARVLAQSVRLAAQATATVGSQRDLAYLAAVAAVETSRNPDTEAALLDVVTRPTGPVRYFSDGSARWSTLRVVAPGVGVVVSDRLQPATVDLVTRDVREIPLPGAEVSEVRAASAPGQLLVLGRRPPSTWVVGTVDAAGGPSDLLQHPVEVTAAVDTPAGLAFGDVDGAVLWAPRTDGVLGAPVEIDHHEAAAITDVAATGEWLASASRSGIRAQRFVAGEWAPASPVVSYERGTTASERVVFGGHDGSVELYGAGSDPTVRRFGLDGDVWTERDPVGRHVGIVDALALDPDASVLYSAGRGGQIQRWDARVGAPIGDPLLAHGSEVRRLSSIGGGTIVSADADEAVLWDLRATRVVERDGVVPDAWSGERFTALVVGDGPVAAITADGLALVADGRSWSVPPRARKAWWTKDGSMIVETGDPSQVDLAPLDLWSTGTGGERQIAERVDAADVGTCLAVTASDRTVAFVDVGGCGDPPAAFDVDVGDVVELALSTDERQVLVAGRRGDIEVHAVDGSLVGSAPSGGSVMPTSVAWLPDGRVVVGHDAGSAVEIVTLGAGTVAELGGHDDAVWWLAVDAGGARLLSAGQDGVIVVSDLATGRQVGSVLIGAQRRAENDPSAVVRGLRLVDDGSALLAIHGDRLVAWELGVDRLTALACANAGRAATSSELTALGVAPDASPCSDAGS
jgi:WD40 repeat protein